MKASSNLANDPDYVCVAVLRGAHGVRGEVKLKSFTQDPEACFGYGPLKTDDGALSLVPVTWRATKDGFVVTLSVQRDREFWEERKGLQLFVERSMLPELEEDEYYIDDLVGLKVTHMDGRPLGRVKAVHNFGAQDILEIVAPDEATSYMLPFSLECIPQVDMDGRELTADLVDDYLPKSILDPDNQAES